MSCFGIQWCVEPATVSPSSAEAVCPVLCHLHSLECVAPADQPFFFCDYINIFKLPVILIFIFEAADITDRAAVQVTVCEFTIWLSHNQIRKNTQPGPLQASHQLKHCDSDSDRTAGQQPFLPGRPNSGHRCVWETSARSLPLSPRDSLPFSDWRFWNTSLELIGAFWTAAVLRSIQNSLSAFQRQSVHGQYTRHERGTAR